MIQKGTHGRPSASQKFFAAPLTKSGKSDQAHRTKKDADRLVHLVRLAKQREKRQPGMRPGSNKKAHRNRQQHASAQTVTRKVRTARAMRMRGAHAHRREEAETKHHRHDQNRMGKCTRRELNHAHPADHDRIGNAHEHLTDESGHDGERQKKCAPVFAKQDFGAGGV